MATNFFNKASLVMIPEAPLEGKVLSVKPEDRSGDFTFSRGSNLAATRVGADGLIEKGRENLLTYSNDFSQWNSGGVTRTGGQSGYDGSNNAWLITSTNVSGVNVSQTVNTSGLKTYSIYAKAGTTNWIRMSFNDTGVNSRAWFDLTNGVLGTNTGDVIDTEITSLGSGWYRCLISVNLSVNASSLYLFVVDGNGLTSASVGDSVYIQDAQLEVGLVATDYIESGATTGKAGLLEDEPRLDYTDSSCPALLLEPLRTNIFTQSEHFNGNAWTSYGGVVLTSNNAVSPEGVQNATKMIDAGGVFDQIPYTQNTDYTYSVFAKTDTATSITIGFVDQSAGYLGGKIRYTFATNVASVLVQSANGSVTAHREDYGNGWFRVIIRFKTNVAQNYNYQFIEFDGGDGWIYGAQLEQGSYATSYIPTYGTSVTRGADLCNGAGDVNTFNSAEGVLYFEVAGFENDLSNRYISISDGTLNNTIRVFYYLDLGTTFFRKNVNGVQTTIFSTSDINKSERNKIAIKYNSTNFDIFSNGVKLSTNLDSNSFPINTLSEVNFANADGFVSSFNGKVNQLLTFNTALSDAECIALTTL